MIGRIWRKIGTSMYKIFNRKLRGTVLYEIPRIYYKDRLKLGKKIHINDAVFINAVGGVEIGDYCVLSHGVSIISTKNDLNKWCSRVEDEEIHLDEEIKIGNNVWLCANVTVCCGTKIASNCVIAAGAVVTSDLLETNCLYGGIPAKKLKELN